MLHAVQDQLAGKERVQRTLRRWNQNGIKIIAPTPFKKKIEQEKLDPDTQLPMLDADGKIITEEKTIQIARHLHDTGRIYDTDLEKILGFQKETAARLNDILTKLSALK